MNDRRLWIAILSLSSLLWAGPASAQLLNHARLEPHEQQLYLELGLSPAVVTSVGYIHSLPLGDRALGLSAEFGMGTAEADLGDYRARLGLEAALLGRGSWRLAARARAVVKGASNDVYDAVGLGADFTGFAGMYRPSWMLVVEGVYDQTFATHVENSEWYRSNVYADARDGWYGDAAGSWYVGLASQKSFGRLDLSLRLGKRWTAGGESVEPPVLGTLALGWRF